MGKPEFHYEALVSHLEEREWSEVQIANLAHMSVTADVMSLQGILRILKYQQEVDEQIAAEKQFDEVYSPEVPAQGWGGGLGKPPKEFFEDAETTFLQQRFGDIL